MSFGNVLLSGNECYSKGLFDEAIDWYTQAANQGYVEGMEKLLKTCVEQGRKYSDALDEKAMEYWCKASMTLRGIMQHGEIAQEIKDRSYTYYDEIMYGIANEYFWTDKYEETLKACNKLNAKDDVIVETIKTYCGLHILVEICRKLVGGIEGGEDKVFPFVDDGGLQDCFKRFGILDSLTEQECKKLAQQTPQAKKMTFSWILYNLSCVFLSGRSGNLWIVEPDEDKALRYWRLRTIVDPENQGYDIPQNVKDAFEGLLKSK